MTDKDLIETFQKVEDTFNKAVVSNMTEEISKCITEDWVLIDAQGGILERESFYHVVTAGLLSHTSMSKEILRAKVYGDMALVTGRGKNTGFFNGEPIEADEWITDVYRYVNGKWMCVLTHLTPVQAKSA